MIFAVVNEEIIGDDNTSHGAKKNTPTTKYSDKCSWVAIGERIKLWVRLPCLHIK